MVSRTFLFPSDKKVPVAVRVLQADEPAAPAFIFWFGNVDWLSTQPLIKIIDVNYAEHEVDAASALQHRLQLLHESNSQRAGLDGSNRRICIGCVGINLKSQNVAIELERIFE